MMIRRVLSTLAVAGALTFAAAAQADVPPPNACDTAGEACNTAGDSFDQPGTCQQTKCSRFNPSDGTTMEYDCTLCLPASGSGGSAGSGGGSTGGSSSAGTGTSNAGTSAGTGTSGGGSDDDDGGCSLNAPGSQGGLAALFVLAGLGAFAVGRRRR